MNRLHRWLCRSTWWRKTLEMRVPWVLSGADLGQSVLELGPGLGLTTDILRGRFEHVTAIEIDAALAESLWSRLRNRNVDVVMGNAAAMPFRDGQFSGALSFTMLHHVPAPQLQDALLHEVRRVIRPGGIFAGTDSVQSLFMKVIHIGDTLVPVDPDGFGTRLEAAGFEVLDIERKFDAFRFQARRPASQDEGARAHGGKDRA